MTFDADGLAVMARLDNEPERLARLPALAQPVRGHEGKARPFARLIAECHDLRDITGASDTGGRSTCLNVVS